MTLFKYETVPSEGLVKPMFSVVVKYFLIDLNSGSTICLYFLSSEEIILFIIVTLLFQFFVFGQGNSRLQLTPLFNGLPLELDKNYILEDSSWYKFSTCRF